MKLAVLHAIQQAHIVCRHNIFNQYCFFERIQYNYNFLCMWYTLQTNQNESGVARKKVIQNGPRENVCLHLEKEDVLVIRIQQ